VGYKAIRLLHLSYTSLPYAFLPHFLTFFTPLVSQKDKHHQHNTITNPINIIIIAIISPQWEKCCGTCPVPHRFLVRLLTIIQSFF